MAPAVIKAAEIISPPVKNESNPHNNTLIKIVISTETVKRESNQLISNELAIMPNKKANMKTVTI